MIPRKAFVITAAVAFTAGIAYFGYSGFIKRKGSYPVLSKCSISMPKPKAWCNDYVSVFSTEERQILDSIIGSHEAETGNEIAIVTIDSSMLGNCSIEDFSTELGNAWGVGKKDKNIGVLMVICPQQRKLRIATGYGSKKILTDAYAGIIIKTQMLPHLRDGEYFEGARAGLVSIINKLKKLP